MSETNPFFEIQEMARGYILPRCLHVIANLGVADALDETPQTTAELAASVGADADSLGRVLALLSSNGVFEAQGETFRHTPASRLLRSDHPQSMRAFVRLFGMPVNWAAYEALEYSVRTGRAALDKTVPDGLWGYYAEHPEESNIFNAAMTAKAQAVIPAVVAAYDFSGFGVIGDIGGGLGHLLRAILDSTPTVKGVLFDLPLTLENAQGMASDRLILHPGDFFADALPICDAYLVMEVIHDWGDEQAVAILKAIRRAAPAHAKLLLIETMIPDDPGPHWSRVLDIHMLTMFGGGRQRTLQQYEALFAQSGFAFARLLAAGAFVSIIEAVPV